MMIDRETRALIEQYKSALRMMYAIGIESGTDYYIDRIGQLRR